MNGSLGTGESVFPLEVMIAAGHTLRTVLLVPIAAGALDPPGAPSPGDPNEGNYIQLDAQLASDGSSITVQEKAHPDAKCAKALARAQCCANTRKVIARACQSVGKYVWRNRFVREDFKAAAPSPQ